MIFERPENTSPAAARHSLGEVQTAIMRVLWARGEASAADVHRDLLADRNLAPTTVATMLAKLEKKGVVDHRTEGRRFIYRPTVSEGEVRRSMVGDLTRRLFAGNPAALVSHLLNEHEIDADELDTLRRRLGATDSEEDRHDP
ncbi:MAG: BlaI/MecI/CopY family transcriptional regulator [Acidobacteriota bacterium]